MMKVCAVRLMGVCFPLKRYAPICPQPVEAAQESHQPFQHIYNIEEHECQLSLLRGMYAFVAERNGVTRALIENYAEKINCRK